MGRRIKLSVEYYNKYEADLFKAYPNYTIINGKISGNFSIDSDELLTYLIFSEQANEDGWRTYIDLKDRVQHRLGDIDDILDFSGGTITAKQSAQRMNASNMTERLGVSLGLNVVNQFHGLTEADWAITDDVYIDGKRIKDFDYEISMASDGQRFIQVENKGSITVDNGSKSSSISQHYGSIKAKKSVVLSRECSAGVPRHQNIYYGTIGVIDEYNVAKVWLVDPVALEIEWNPLKYKLLSRLIFYVNLFRDVGVHKRILTKLHDRIEQIKTSKDFMKFNKIRLSNLEKIPKTYLSTKNFVAINSNEAFGTFFFIKTEQRSGVYIVAVTREIIMQIINQDFEGILNYEFTNANLPEKAIVELSTKLSQATDDFETSNVEFVLDKKRKRYFFQYYGEMNYSSSGRIFGMIEG